LPARVPLFDRRCAHSPIQDKASTADSGYFRFAGGVILDLEYKQILTGDGSPTLSIAPTFEHMHAIEGAFTETQYIYQPTVEKAFNTVSKPVFLSLGLGLGYNELLIAFESLRHGRIPELIASYESVVPLKEAFESWLMNDLVPLTPVYDQITEMYAEKYDREPVLAKSLLLDLLQENKLRLLGPVEKEVLSPSHAILFDAFSTKTSPELWTPEFLNGFFGSAAANPCFMSTYACNGELKRALKNNAFILDIQKGFGMKRESTFASKSAPQ